MLHEEEDGMSEAYKQRVLDEIIEKRLHNKGAVLLEGAKWCGKTLRTSYLP